MSTRGPEQRSQNREARTVTAETMRSEPCMALGIVRQNRGHRNGQPMKGDFKCRQRIPDVKAGDLPAQSRLKLSSVNSPP